MALFFDMGDMFKPSLALKMHITFCLRNTITKKVAILMIFYLSTWEKRIAMPYPSPHLAHTPLND